MRTVIIMLFAALLCGRQAAAQQTNVPQVVKSSFAHEYTKAEHVKWNKEDGKYEASFKQDANAMSVLYDASGNKLETEVTISIASLPKDAQKYALSKGAIKDAAKITAANGTVTYEAEVNGMDLIFDAQGKFITERKD